jgi:hypothetical protein
MGGTDPSGYFLDGLFSIPIIDNAWNNHIKPYAPVIASIVASYYTFGYVGLLSGNAMVAGAAAGVVGGAILGGNLQSAFYGGLTGAAFAGVGDLWDINTDPFANIAGHAAVGCGSSMLNGRSCGSGALSAGFSDAASPFVSSNNAAIGTMETALIGGTASVIAGGKFANGAQTAAFGYMFNYLAHGHDITRTQGQSLADDAVNWKDTPYASAGTAFAGAAAMQGVGADCSGSTCQIFDQVGLVYKYESSGQLAAAAAQDGFPFRQLTANEVPQSGDVILFTGHMAIYAGQDNNGNALMWTARGVGRPYTEMPVKYWNTRPIGYYRYQVPNGSQ